MRYVASMRCNCRNMAHIMEKRDRMEGGNSQLPRTRTSRVPGAHIRIGEKIRADYEKSQDRDKTIPSRASSKQCFGSQWLVKMTTRWPRFCSPTAASMISRSAPPIPRSGWKNKNVRGFVAVVVAVLESGLRAMLQARSWCGLL